MSAQPELVTAMRPARAPLLLPLREHDFRLLWVGFTTSTLGDQISLVALAWLALQLTGSPLSVGGVLTAAAVPRAVLSLLGGAVSDRVGARRLGIITSLARVVVMGTLATLVLAHAIQLGELYLLALLFGVVDAFFGPTRASLIAQSVPPDQMEAANSLTGSTSSLTLLLGPAAGGVLVARAGTGYAIAADALLFACVAVTTFGMRSAGAALRDNVAAGGIWRDVGCGLGYVFRDPVLRTLLLITTTMGFAVAGPTDVGLAALARTRFDGAVGLGVLLGSFGAGMLVGTLAAGVVRTRRVTPRLAGAALVFAALMPLLGVAPSLPVAIALIVVMGAAAGQVNVIASAWLMRRTDPALIGRVMSLLIVSSAGVSPVSLAVAGALAQVSVPLVFTTSGALMLLAAIAALANRTMRAT